MRRLLPSLLSLSILLCGFISPAKAQDSSDDAGAYIDAINKAETNMNKAYMAYVSAAAHSSRKRKIDKMRDHAVENIITCQNEITDLSPFKGDNSLRQNSLNYV